MDTGEAVFADVMDARRRYVTRLADNQLHALIGHLGRNLDENGETGVLMGECLQEAVDRLKKS